MFAVSHLLPQKPSWPHIDGWAGSAMLIAALLALKGEGNAGQPASTRPAFQQLRYDEDYGFLKDPSARTDFWDPIKYIAIGKAGYLSVGGEIRERFEAYENEFFSTHPNADNAYFLHRYLFHVDYHPADWLRVFGQIQGVFEDGRPGGPRPTDRGGNDIHQLFGDVVFHFSKNTRMTLRSGRQEFSYGSERLISAREGTNSRRAFDAVRLLFVDRDLKIDAFVASPVENDDDSFDDQHVRNVRFWGIYGTTPLRNWPDANLDFYYLGLRDPSALFNQGTGKEERHTLGMRFFGKVGRFDFNNEVFYQFGRFGSGDIAAWSIATDQGFTFDQLWFKPRLGLKAAIASGDRDSTDADLETFNPLFPRGNYFTEAALLGPTNFIALRPRITLHPSEDLTFDLGVDFFWRQDRNDGIYNPGGRLIYPGNPSFSRWVGTDFTFVVTWQATRHLTIGAAYSHFFAGDFIHENSGQDVDFCGAWASFKF